jgi:TRAP-type C4-dicarboxylate transport system permease large subunit
VVANQAIALVTPPVGNCLYICSNLANVGIEKLLISSLPYLLSNLLVLLLVTFFPRLVLFLPSLLMP